ncbi:MAG: OadG-related small transporter subunit [Saccharofermentanales bacterium]
MDKIIAALEIMGKGMIGIFISLSIIFLFVTLLIKIFPEKIVSVEENPEEEN